MGGMNGILGSGLVSPGLPTYPPTVGDLVVTGEITPAEALGTYTFAGFTTNALYGRTPYWTNGSWFILYTWRNAFLQYDRWVLSDSLTVDYAEWASTPDDANADPGNPVDTYELDFNAAGVTGTPIVAEA